MRPLNVPLVALAVAREDEGSLSCADQHANAAHISIPPVVRASISLDGFEPTASTEWQVFERLTFIS